MHSEDLCVARKIGAYTNGYGYERSIYEDHHEWRLIRSWFEHGEHIGDFYCVFCVKTQRKNLNE